MIGVINPNVPAICNAPWVERSRFAETVESDAAIVTYEVGEIDPATGAIARHIAKLIPDGATIQIGLGKVPHALMQALHGHRRLRIHSGMVSDGLIGIAEAGALDEGFQHRTTAVLGSRSLYDWVAGRTDIHVRSVADIHMPAILAGLDRFVAVNSALEVDLLGQCNLEHASGRAVSGGGGASDFARAARLGRGGLSIVALPATFGATGSRIVARLSEGAVTSLARNDVDIVVTEEGVADLRGSSVHERAEALIRIASPAARPMLENQWREIAARL
jgi:acyl-CoA hydrolase